MYKNEQPYRNGTIILEEKTNIYWLKNRTIIGNSYSGLAISLYMYLKLKNNEDKTSC